MSEKEQHVPCEDCTTRMQQAVHDLHVELHPDGGRGCAECRRTVLLVAESLNFREGHVLPPINVATPPPASCAQQSPGALSPTGVAVPSVDATPDTATVLAGLVEEMRAMWRDSNAARNWQRCGGIADAIGFVEAAQEKAATGARAAGGADVPELWWSPSKARETTTDLLGGLSYRYVSPGGFETPTNLRDDAVRLVAAPFAPAAHGVAGYVLGTCFRDTQGNPHREGWSGDWYATRALAEQELAKWPGNEDHEAAVFEVRLAYDPHQHVWCPTCDDYPGGRCTDHTGRVCCITHGTRLVLLAPGGADDGGNEK